MLTAIIVPKEAAAILTKLFPSRIADRNIPGFSFRLFNRSANLTSLLSRCFTRILLIEIIATSALEKNAESTRQKNIITKYKVCELSIYNPEYVPGYVYNTIRYVYSQRKGIRQDFGSLPKTGQGRNDRIGPLCR